MVLFFKYDKNTLNISIDEKDLIFILNFFKFHSIFQYKIITTISGIDYPNRQKRFEILYELLSLRYNSRLRLNVFINDVVVLPSIVSIFPAATWFEREIWDLFGVFFYGNDEIKRILTDYGFEGHPLRKDFPLSGYVESRYNDKTKRIVIETLEHSQHFRLFNFLSPWDK